MYQFTEDCRLGIPEIDEEHQQLFSLINEGYQLLSLDRGLISSANTLLSHLKDYADTHFAHEEAYMKSIGDPELTTQKREHEEFSHKMNAIDLSGLSQEEAKPILNNLLNYLSRWLFRHILGSDTLIGKNQSPFSFTSKYMTGIDPIDAEHRRLFEILEETHNITHDEYLFDKYDKTVTVLNQLKEYTKEHFSHEEAFMEDIGYPDIKRQKAAHTAFCDSLAEIKLEEMDENQQEYLESLIDFLLNWLSVHIMHMDKAIGDYLATRNA